MFPVIYIISSNEVIPVFRTFFAQVNHHCRAVQLRHRYFLDRVSSFIKMDRGIEVGPAMLLGCLDEIKVWTRALSGEEIGAEYKADQPKK